MKNRLFLISLLLFMITFNSCSDEFGEAQFKALVKEYGLDSIYAQQYPELYVQDEDDLWHTLMLVDESKEYEMGVIAALRLLEMNPQDDEVYHELALFLCAMGNESGAAALYQRALHFNPNNHASLYNLGELYMVHQRYYEAQNVLEQAYELEPENQQYAIQLAKVYLILRREVDALSLYLPIVYSQDDSFFSNLTTNLYQMYADVYYDLALLYWQGYGQLESALFYLDKYDNLMPNDYDARQLRALIMHQQENQVYV